jgi:hypothetical protein
MGSHLLQIYHDTAKVSFLCKIAHACSYESPTEMEPRSWARTDCEQFRTANLSTIQQ